MKNWQKDRNYKRVKDKDGNVVANIITVFGQDVEVSDEDICIYTRRWTGVQDMSERTIPRSTSNFAGTARGKKVYISKRWKTQNRVRRNVAWNMRRKNAAEQEAQGAGCVCLQLE